MTATDIKNDANLGASLVSCWMSDSSGLVTDLVTGTGNDLTNNNTVTEVAGVQGDAGDFEASSSQSLSIADASQTGLDLTGDCSFAVWVKPETVTGEDTLFSKWDTSASNERSYLFDMINDQLCFAISGNGTVAKQNCVAQTFDDATQYHVGVAFDASEGSADLYVNGSKIGVTQTGYATSIHSGTAVFYLGASEETPARFLDGVLNQAVVWSKVLDATGFADLYNSGTGIPFEGAAATNANFLNFM